MWLYIGLIYCMCLVGKGCFFLRFDFWGYFIVVFFLYSIYIVVLKCYFVLFYCIFIFCVFLNVIIDFWSGIVLRKDVIFSIN